MHDFKNSDYGHWSRMDLKMFQFIRRFLKYDNGKLIFDVSSEWMYEVDFDYNDDLVELFEVVSSVFSELCFSKYKVIFDPTSVIMLRAPEFLREYNIKMLSMEKVYKHQVPDKNDREQPYPSILPEIPVVVALVQAMLVKEGISKNIWGVGFGERGGLPNAVVTGTHTRCNFNNYTKMAINKLEPGECITQELMVASVLALMKDVGWSRKDLLDFEVPDFDILYDLIGTYNTSTGLLPIRDAVTLKINKKGVAIEMNGYPSKKKFAALQITKLVYGSMERLLDKANLGLVQGSVYPGNSILYSSIKYEILNGLISTESFQELLDFHEKGRVFFIEAAHYVMLSHVLLIGVFNHLHGPGFEIGLKICEGQMNSVFDYHDCGSTVAGNKDKEALYLLYPLLKERKYFEGDFKGYDESLLYKILFFSGVFLCTFYNYDGKKGVAAMSAMGDMVYRLVFKYLYLTSKGSLYFVKGKMFSGKFETSHGNTIYQNLVFFMYLIKKSHDFRDHEFYWLLKIGIDNKLITRSFSGDDNLIGYPLVFEYMFNICADDYFKFCSECGLNKKYVRSVPLFGKAVFNKKNMFYSEDKSLFVDSCIFLKCAVKDIYENDGSGMKYKGRYLYRPTDDLIFRWINSDKANRYIESFFAKTMSLMYLSVGNIEAYSILSVGFYLAKKIFKWQGVMEKDAILRHLGSSFNPELLDLVFDYCKTNPVVSPPSLDIIRNHYVLFTPILSRPLLSFNQIYKYKIKGVSDLGFFSNY